MSTRSNLDLPTEAAVYIPYEPPVNSSQQRAVEVWVTGPQCVQRDLPNGPHLRLAAYKKAWESCLNRMKEIIHELNVAIITKVVHAVEHAYLEQNILLPFTELPTIGISGTDRSAMKMVFADIFEQLDKGSDDNDPMDDEDIPMTKKSDAYREARIAYVVSLSPTECTNLQSTMKMLIAGFINQSFLQSDLENMKPSASLALYDINLLRAWYRAIKKTRGEDDLPRLVVLLEEFEQWETSLVEDLLYICSLHIPELPFVFMLAMASPPLPSYVHETYPKSMLALVELEVLAVPGGPELLDELLLKTFFDTSYTPHVLLGPAAIQFVVDQFTNYVSSIDFVFSIIQLLYMRHFMEPLTAFVLDDLRSHESGEEFLLKLRDLSAVPFLQSLLARLHSFSGKSDILEASIDDADSAFKAIIALRDSARMRIKRSALAFEVFRLVQAFLLKQGYETVDSGRTRFEMMKACLRGTLASKEGKYLTTVVRKLSAVKLAKLLTELHNYFNTQSTAFQDAVESIVQNISEAVAALPDTDVESFDCVTIAKDIGDELYKFFLECMTNFSDIPLWDVWYIGQATMLTEIINSSPRLALKEGLLHPEKYIPQETPVSAAEAGQNRIMQISDLTVAFQRYLEGGKTINVYDWYDSFVMALNTRRKAQLRVEKQHMQPENKSTPKKIGRPGKWKGKAKVVTTVPEDESGSPPENGLADVNDEDWQQEVLARFIRCIHELDYMGFIKHTNRKVDHVTKTFFDPPVYDDD